MTIFRFWYYGAYVDVQADTAEQAKDIVSGLATVSSVNVRIFACVPIIGEPERMDDV